MHSQIPTIPEKSRPLRSVMVTNRQTQIPSQPYAVNSKVDPSIEEEVEGLFRPSQEPGESQEFPATEAGIQGNGVHTAYYDNRVQGASRVSNPHTPNNPYNPHNPNNPHNAQPVDRMPAANQIRPTVSPSATQYRDMVRVHDVLDSMYWKIIPYDYFNRIQSATCDALLHSNENIVVSAPTVPSSSPFSPPQGCGKTVLLELAVLKLHHEWATDPSTSPSASFPYSIVYVCPTKALCNEIFTKWSSTFASLGLRCVVWICCWLCRRKLRGTPTRWSRVFLCFILHCRTA